MGWSSAIDRLLKKHGDYRGVDKCNCLTCRGREAERPAFRGSPFIEKSQWDFWGFLDFWDF